MLLAVSLSQGVNAWSTDATNTCESINSAGDQADLMISSVIKQRNLYEKNFITTILGKTHAVNMPDKTGLTGSMGSVECVVHIDKCKV
jgi:hypothetical protein